MRYAVVIASLVAWLAADAAAQGIILERRFQETRPPERDIVRPEPPARWPMQLKEHRVAIEIEDQAAVTKVTQVFHNPNAWPMEGVYLFPLPDHASVSRFTMSMAGKQVPGELLDANRARDIYRSIVHRRRDPGLLEYAGRRLIRARLFPLPARGDTTVELRFEQLLEPVGGMVELVYPLKTDAFSPGIVATSGRIEIRSQAGIATVFSPSHALDVVRRGETHAVASFEERGRADRDLQLLYGLGKKEFGVSLATHDAPGEDGTFLLLVSPRVPDGDVPVMAKDIVFVLDTSGSMGDRGGTKMKQAKAALEYALGRLSPGDRFNVIAFATEPRPFRDGVVAASSENVAAALGFVRGLEATGGTAIHDALGDALRLERASGRVPLVFFLTDGEPTIGPTDPDTILAAVEKANAARARLFVFGVGDDVNATLLTELSDASRGTAHFVSERENIELKVSALYDQVASPVLTDVTVAIDGAGVHDVYPRRIGDLFEGQQVAILGRYARGGAHAITLSGRMGERDVRLVYEARFGGGAGRDYLPRLWAVRKVGHLLSEIRRNGEKAELVAEVERLGTRYGIVTPYTSFLVVEESELLERRIRRLDGGDAPGAPAEREAILRAREALDDLGADAAFAGEALKKGEAAGRGAVAGAKMALDYERAQRTGGAVGVKRVGDRTFRLVDGIWTDLAVEAHPEAEVVRVAYLSEEYDRLLEDAVLARLLSVGPRVKIYHDGKIYVVEAE